MYNSQTAFTKNCKLFTFGCTSAISVVAKTNTNIGTL